MFQPIWALRGGCLTFDRSRRWCLIESELDVEPEHGVIARERTKIEYTGRGEVPTPKRVVRLLQHPKYNLEWDFQVDDFVHRIVADGEMSLTAFGLPEFGQKEFQSFKSMGSPIRVGEVENSREAKGPLHVVGLIVLIVALVAFLWRRLIYRAKCGGLH